MYKIQTLNNISVKGLDRLPRDRYEVASEIGHPDAVLVRSFKMHDMVVPETVVAIGRAGAGVNNIPVEAMSQRGVAVFNAPGANANAVKELVLAGMFLAARNICQAWDYTRSLEGDDASLNSQVEAGKKQFVGFELPGRTLGVIGLGAIGVKVANAASALGMNVVGFDPGITVGRAWELESDVRQAHTVDEVVGQSDFISVHVPINDHTRNLINGDRLRMMPAGGVVLNFSRAGIIDDEAAIAALDEGHLSAYVNDFPTNLTRQHPRCITLPHLGASTREAEENCAVLVADQIRDYLENGNVRNSVNFPEVVMPRGGKGDRLSLVNSNVPNMLGQISTALASAGLNIDDMYNKSRGDLAYTLVDVEGEIPAGVIEDLRGIEGVLAVRVIR
ncbi:D-3-phosphoglycerate dehydrogenase [Natronocella acetinitrilica]|jgi:D-3-phosphoglycerate dehydrogenase / 2-oxoglutarate reductase|uniref:D-3-phosphoglycerate dehydrogenase n=1 Tax=Natronocella acetinitrilica TaxID=414046 RepID=A0AAE3KBL6_9GAMM|nr:phosphoglycerate dehydrogenase [Natronocella acetinitrilica]MCP1674796.1 D-3-phosphoglycerate dehydrogenase [Natronocella acetinitrilica]